MSSICKFERAPLPGDRFKSFSPFIVDASNPDNQSLFNAPRCHIFSQDLTTWEGALPYDIEIGPVIDAQILQVDDK